MTNTLLKCITCDNIFRSRYDLNNHVKRDHQSSVKVKFQSGAVTEVKKAEDDTFKCKCGKSFKLPGSLQRHAKDCNGEARSYEDEEKDVQMSEGFSDASENANYNEGMIDDSPVDCFDALISHDFANCRGRATSKNRMCYQ
jgi:uncharacterized C2H2 Zn-finger protein